MNKILNIRTLCSILKISRRFCSYSFFLQPQEPSNRLPINVTDFEDLITPENNYAFVDKTLLIKEIVAKKHNYLILRPDGWGKSLNLSMLKCFFSIMNHNNQIIADGFSKLKISQEVDPNFLKDFAFKFPVIHLNLDLEYTEEPTMNHVLEKFVKAIRDCYRQHKYLTDSPHLLEEEKEHVRYICEQHVQLFLNKEQERIIHTGLAKLSELLYKHYGSKSIILMDDYDVPAHMGIIGGFYPQILMTMQHFFDNTLSNNSNLYKAIIMGTMPITKTYLFSSLKAITSITPTSGEFEEYYGFTENEVKHLLQQCPYIDSTDPFEQIYYQYKGYYSHAARRKTIYNPSSILNHIEAKGETTPGVIKRSRRELDFMYHLFITAPPHDFNDIMNLAYENFRYVDRNVHWHIIDKLRSHPNRLGLFYNPVKIWSILFFMGYLTLESSPVGKGAHYQCRLSIPNKEMMGMFNYLKARLMKEKEILFEDMKKALKEKDLKLFFERCTKAIRRRIIWEQCPRWDFAKEKHYHEYLEALFGELCSDEFEIISEEKSGEGRADIILLPKIVSGIKHAYIFELKYTDDYSKVGRMISIALEQIYDRDYVSRIIDKTHVEEIILVGVAGTDQRYLQCASRKVLR